MKLFTRYSRINVVATVIIFLIASIAFYFTLNYVLQQQIDEDLSIERGEIKAYVDKYDRLPENIAVKDQVINYRLTAIPGKKSFYTTIDGIDPEDKDKEKYRQLIFSIAAGGKWYEVTVSKSLEDTNGFVRSVLLITIITILLILVASFIINRFVLKKIWKPFYYSLDTVKDFKVSKNSQLQFKSSGIDEFDFMNQTLQKITARAQMEYLSLKTFSENASHEIQTPIAIIRSKLDLMIQDEELTERQSQTLQSAYQAIDKLARLNQSLLLLARIENNQYEETQVVDLKLKLEEKMNDFQELWQSQQITVKPSLQDADVNMNKELTDILLNNLLSNATRHNYSGGNIGVELENGQLTISNSGEASSLDQAKVFQRFYKAPQGNGRNGLGLSIIKQICDVSGFTIDYFFEKGRHGFLIRWSGEK